MEILVFVRSLGKRVKDGCASSEIDPDFSHSDARLGGQGVKDE